MAEVSSDTIKPVLIIDQLIEKLREEISNGTLKGGASLREVELQNRFGISRTPLREAFRELERLGFVEIRPRQGTYVKEISLKETVDIYEVRSVLEGLAARLSMQRKDDFLTSLESALAGMDHAFNKEDWKAFLIAHDHFHDAWLDNCENKLLRDEALRLRALTSWHRRYFDFSDIDFKSSLQVHRKILEVVKISSPEEAGKVENIVKENILSAVTRILRATRNEKE